MVSRAQAQVIADSHISDLAGSERSFAILEAETVERSFGWVFFYQSRRYLETDNPSDALAGNAPLIVDRLTGQVTETGTVYPLEYYLSQYKVARDTGAA
ncbi:YrhB domain-containing protein [Luteimonas arsenica]|uniref:YrhB domain-containing protein n=1 Tax=Luteimonas arsenica TaxID=1586242 RepID=UPI001054C67E|nr:YrhB domain-containing protein [Luteimonas arsenica]